MKGVSSASQALGQRLADPGGRRTGQSNVHLGSLAHGLRGSARSASPAKNPGPWAIFAAASRVSLAYGPQGAENHGALHPGLEFRQATETLVGRISGDRQLWFRIVIKSGSPWTIRFMRVEGLAPGIAPPPR